MTLMPAALSFGLDTALSLRLMYALIIFLAPLATETRRLLIVSSTPDLKSLSQLGMRGDDHSGFGRSKPSHHRLGLPV